MKFKAREGQLRAHSLTGAHLLGRDTHNQTLGNLPAKTLLDRCTTVTVCKWVAGWLVRLCVIDSLEKTASNEVSQR